MPLLLQGYSSSKDQKGTFLDDWDVSEAGEHEASEVSSCNSSILTAFNLFLKLIIQ